MKNQAAPYKDYNALYKDHWENNLSLAEIAKKYDIHCGTIQYWFKILKVPTRTREEASKLATENNKFKRERTVNQKIIVKCSNCNAEKEVWNYRLKDTKDFYCSKKCKSEHWSKTYTGENAFNWKGGHWSETVSKRQWSKFVKLKKIIKERDNYTCQLCGSHKKLVVHHIIPVRDDVTLIFEETNLITLCDDCHVNKVNFHEYEYVIIFIDIVAKGKKSVKLQVPSKVTDNTEPSQTNGIKCSLEGVTTNG